MKTLKQNIRKKKLSTIQWQIEFKYYVKMTLKIKSQVKDFWASISKWHIFLLLFFTCIVIVVFALIVLRRIIHIRVIRHDDDVEFSTNPSVYTSSEITMLVKILVGQHSPLQWNCIAIEIYLNWVRDILFTIFIFREISQRKIYL